MHTLVLVHAPQAHTKSLECSAVVYYFSGMHSALSLILTASVTLRFFFFFLEEFEHVPVNGRSVKINIDKIFLMVKSDWIHHEFC